MTDKGKKWILARVVGHDRAAMFQVPDWWTGTENDFDVSMVTWLSMDVYRKGCLSATVFLAPSLGPLVGLTAEPGKMLKGMLLCWWTPSEYLIRHVEEMWERLAKETRHLEIRPYTLLSEYTAVPKPRRWWNIFTRR